MGWLATMIVMRLRVVFVRERPFGGLMRLQPEALSRSLQVFRSDDRTLDGAGAGRS